MYDLQVGFDSPSWLSFKMLKIICKIAAGTLLAPPVRQAAMGLLIGLVVDLGSRAIVGIYNNLRGGPDDNFYVK